MKHILNEIKSTKSCSLRTDARSTKVETLACKRTCMLLSQFLVHSIHIAHFSSAYTDITGRNVAVRTEIAPQLKNERLAETHDFLVRLSARAEVRTTLAATHRKSGQRILERLLEAQEFEN